VPRIKDDLKRQTMAVYDDTAAIGKLYRRQDEIGTPWCVTVDVDSLADGNVTVRGRDAMTQERISADQVTRYITDKLDAARPEDCSRSAARRWDARRRRRSSRRRVAVGSRRAAGVDGRGCALAVAHREDDRRRPRTMSPPAKTPGRMTSVLVVRCSRPG